MAASRGWIGAHYPHHVLSGFIVGALVARLATWTVRRKLSTLAARLMDGPLLTTACPGHQPTALRPAPTTPQVHSRTGLRVSWTGP
ncbi:hypothetical protein ACWDRZ_25625 [Streptomyces sp. NPDC003509]